MTDLREQLQASLGAAYALERELGGGGMSRVFLATETALGRRVVVKVLSPELAQGLSADRFAREIKLAAALQDPHIVPVLAAGDAAGLPYYTMPFVEGESLRARLLRGALPLGEALSVLRDVALALEYAHARGVVHRDIKPENVLLAGRTAVVADFGIAKAVSAARADGSRATSGTLTSIGQSLGTPAYMAPEQAAGDPTDHRADLYAWGMMAYELLAGRHAFADKATTAQLMAAQVMEKPEPLADRKPGLPPPISALVMKCLEKEMDARPQSAAEVVQSLDGVGSPGSASVERVESAERPARRAAAAPSPSPRKVPALPISLGVVALSVAVVFFVTRGRSASPSATTAAVTGGAAASDSVAASGIAVLPFENLGDTSQAYFAAGITDAVRTKLVGLQSIRVIARGSSNLYRGTTKSPSEIARELGVRYLLTGAVRFAAAGSGARVQVTPELVEVTATGQPESRWTEAFDAEVKDVFKVQGDIAGKVASAMQVALGGTAQAQLARAPTENAEAYDAYLRGQAAWNFEGSVDPRSLRAAVGFFEQAVAHDPKFVDAWAAIGRTWSLLYANAAPLPEYKRKSLEAVRRAMALDPASPAVHRSMSAYYTNVEDDYARALQEAESAARAAPGDATLQGALAGAKEQLGRFEEAMQHRRAALAVDPRAPSRWSALGNGMLWLRRYDESRKAVDRALALAPTSVSATEYGVMALLGMGDLDAARRAMATASKDIPSAAVAAYIATYWDLGWTLDPEMERTLLTLGPDAFDDEKGTWGLVRAQQHHWRGEESLARQWGDTAVRYFREQMKQSPNDQQLRLLLALSLAHAGKSAEAIAEGERGLAMRTMENGGSHLSIPYLMLLQARVYLFGGEREKAVAILEKLMSMPFYVSRAWLRIDPTWKPLKGDPRFERLISGP